MTGRSMGERARYGDPEEIERLRSMAVQGAAEPAHLVRLAALLFVDPNHDPHELLTLLQRCRPGHLEYVEGQFWKAKVLYHRYVDSGKAASVLRRATELDEKRADCLSLLASCEMDIGAEPGEYIDYLKRATTVEPTWVIPRQMLARTMIKVRDRHEAARQVAIARLYVNTVREPKDPVEYYYECCVTGRLNSDVDELDRLELRAKLPW